MTASQLLGLVQNSPLPNEQKSFWQSRIPNMDADEMQNLTYILTANSTQRLDQLDAWAQKRQSWLKKRFSETVENGVRSIYRIAERKSATKENADSFLSSSLSQL